jgi:hypothetical protein
MCMFIELQSGKEHSGRLGYGLIVFEYNLVIARTSAASLTRIKRSDP